MHAPRSRLLGLGALKQLPILGGTLHGDNSLAAAAPFQRILHPQAAAMRNPHHRQTGVDCWHPMVTCDAAQSVACINDEDMHKQLLHTRMPPF